MRCSWHREQQEQGGVAVHGTRLANEPGQQRVQQNRMGATAPSKTGWEGKWGGSSRGDGTAPCVARAQCGNEAGN